MLSNPTLPCIEKKSIETVTVAVSTQDLARHGAVY
jgi:hypothetical protein